MEGEIQSSPSPSRTTLLPPLMQLITRKCSFELLAMVLVIIVRSWASKVGYQVCGWLDLGGIQWTRVPIFDFDLFRVFHIVGGCFRSLLTEKITFQHDNLSGLVYYFSFNSTRKSLRRLVYLHLLKCLLATNYVGSKRRLSFRNKDCLNGFGPVVFKNRLKFF